VKAVLYVSGEIAIWFGFVRNEISEMHVERISGELVQPYLPCDWLSENQHQIHLVVDSSQEEIEAHPFMEQKTFLPFSSAVGARKNQLSQQYPQAIVRIPSTPKNTNTILVQHLNLPAATLAWINNVQSANLTICSLSTVTEVLAEFFQVGSEQCITLTCSQGYIKHTYCRAGDALFSRTVNKVSDAGMTEQLSETLLHLVDTKLISSPIPVYAVGLPQEIASDLASLEYVSDLKQSENWLQFGEGSVSAEQDSLPTQYSMEILIADTVKRRRNVRSIGRRRHATAFISKYRQARNQRQQAARVAIVASATCFAALLAGSNEIGKRQTRETFAARQVMLMKTISELRQQAAALDPNAAKTADTLMQLLTLDELRGVSPSEFLSMLSNAFKVNRDLVLNELMWVLREDSGPKNGAHKSDALQSRLMHRPSLEVLPVETSVVHLSVSGVISGDISLREQQHAFDSFVSDLRKTQFTKELTVLQAPLLQSLSPNLDEGLLSASKEFQVLLELHAISSRDS